MMRTLLIARALDLLKWMTIPPSQIEPSSGPRQVEPPMDGGRAAVSGLRHNVILKSERLRDCLICRVC